MDHLKLISDLCSIVDQQNTIIKTQAIALTERDTVVMAEETAEAHRTYEETMGLRDFG